MPIVFCFRTGGVQKTNPVSCLSQEDSKMPGKVFLCCDTYRNVYKADYEKMAVYKMDLETGSCNFVTLLPLPPMGVGVVDDNVCILTAESLLLFTPGGLSLSSTELWSPDVTQMVVVGKKIVIVYESGYIQTYELKNV